MKVYSLKSKSLGYFNTPFCMEDDLTCINHLRNSIISAKDESFLRQCDDLELYSLGEFSVKDGLTKAKQKFVIDCKEIPLIAELAKEAMKNEQTTV